MRSVACRSGVCWRGISIRDEGSGIRDQGVTDPESGASIVTTIFALMGVVLLVAGVAGWIAREGAFFGAGSALLIASLCLFSLALRRHSASALTGHGWQPVSRLGFRYARYRPGRSVLSMAVIASATFILISVDAFRRGEQVNDTSVRSGVGGYAVFVETLLPIAEDVNSRSGRESLGLFDLDPAVVFEPFRLLPGDDASCLNLYEPRNPRILAPTDAFLAKGRFGFQASRASSDEERANPWLLLTRGGSGRRDPGHCRRELDDLRPAQAAWRRPGRSGAGAGTFVSGSSPRFATASFRASS